MNTKIGIAILLAACVGLAVVLAVVKTQDNNRHEEDAKKISDFSSQLDEASTNLNDLRQTNLKLNTDLEANRAAALAFSNSLAETKNALDAAQTAYQNAQVQLTNAQVQIATDQSQITNLNDRIASLETQNQALDQRASALSDTIKSLDAQIAATQSKLASSQTNNAFLEAELKREVAQREDLQRQFNDLKIVRQQVTKLRNDLIAARELEWMHEGIDPANPMKGGQLLMMRNLPVPKAAATAHNPAYDLNVEVRSDGSVHVIPPMTNSPSGTTPSH
jgi:chromosome segregation ATPase